MSRLAHPADNSPRAGETDKAHGQHGRAECPNGSGRPLRQVEPIGGPTAIRRCGKRQVADRRIASELIARKGKPRTDLVDAELKRLEELGREVVVEL